MQGPGKLVLRLPVFALLTTGILGLLGCNPEPNELERGLAASDEVSVITEYDDAAFGEYHAIIIGIDDYENWPRLKYAEGDAADVHRILNANYGFDAANTVSLYGADATRQRILSEIYVKLESLDSDDNLIVFYAGHGQLDPLTESGFWIPVEGHIYDDSSWIRFSTILDYLKADNVQAKSIVVVTDSCYGGAITRSGPTPGHKTPDQDYERYRQTLLALAGSRSRHVIASGGYEQVPDRSYFADLFKAALENNQLSLIDMEYLFFTRVYPELRQIGVQEPAMARLASGPDANGQFVLVRSTAIAAGSDTAGVPITVDSELAPAISMLTVRSNVDDDSIAIDGEHKGSTRLDIDLIPGRHRVVVSKAGYNTYDETVEFEPGEHRELFAELTPDEMPAPDIVEFTANPLSARPNETLTLRWRTNNAESVHIAAASNEGLAAAGTIQVRAHETTNYVLEATNAKGESVTRSVQVNVSARVPRIVTFAVTPERARAGQQVIVSWRTEDAAAVAITGFENLETSGSRTVTADASRRFVLKAVSEDREVARASIALEVIGPPKITSFQAAQTKIYKGNSTRLTWRTENADLVELSGVGKVSTQGYREVAPETTERFRLIAYGGSQKHESEIVVTVESPLTTVDPGKRVVYQPKSPLLNVESLITAKLAVAASDALTLRQTYTVDLDTGKVGAGTASDLWFEAKTATQRYLTPKNGATIALVTGNEPGYNGCSKTALSTRLIDIAAVKPGAFVCVKTNRGRISQFTPTRAVGASPGTLYGNFTTWQ